MPSLVLTDHDQLRRRRLKEISKKENRSDINIDGLSVRNARCGCPGDGFAYGGNRHSGKWRDIARTSRRKPSKRAPPALNTITEADPPALAWRSQTSTTVLLRGHGSNVLGNPRAKAIVVKFILDFGIS